MHEFGSANNFSGNIGEQALKGIVKDHTEKTQRRPDKFAERYAMCKYESNIIKYVMGVVHAYLDQKLLKSQDRKKI